MGSGNEQQRHDVNVAMRGSAFPAGGGQDGKGNNRNTQKTQKNGNGATGGFNLEGIFFEVHP